MESDSLVAGPVLGLSNEALSDTTNFCLSLDIGVRTGSDSYSRLRCNIIYKGTPLTNKLFLPDHAPRKEALQYTEITVSFYASATQRGHDQGTNVKDVRDAFKA